MAKQRSDFIRKFLIVSSMLRRIPGLGFLSGALFKLKLLRPAPATEINISTASEARGLSVAAILPRESYDYAY